MATVGGSICQACGADVSGRYCSSCGEAAGRHDYSMVHLAEEVLESVAHVDGRVFTTFRTLLTRPGLLASQFLAGRRKTQMGPVQLFVVCNVIYFLLQPFSFFVPFTSTLGVQTTSRMWAGFARGLVNARIGARHITFEQYAAVFDEAAHLQGKTLVMIMVPLFAAGAWTLHSRARRFYAEHLVVSFYTYAFVLLWMGVGTVALSKAFLIAVRYGWRPSGDLLEGISTPIIVLPFVVYVFLTERCVYEESVLGATVKTVVLTGWAVAVLTVYRFILFFTSFYAT